MRSLLCAAVMMTAATAQAEDRTMVVNAGATFGAVDGMDADPAQGLFGPRVTLAWEHAPVEMPATGFHSWTRFGFELAVVSARRFAVPDEMASRDWGVGGVAQFFIGFKP